MDLLEGGGNSAERAEVGRVLEAQVLSHVEHVDEQTLPARHAAVKPADTQTSDENGLPGSLNQN